MEFYDFTKTAKGKHIINSIVVGKRIVVIENEDEQKQGLKLQNEGAILAQLAGDTKDLSETHLDNCLFHTGTEGKAYEPYERFFVGVGAHHLLYE